jgi:hypothetical protein
MGAIFGGMNTTQQTNSATNHVVPAFLSNQAQTNLANADSIASQPYVGQQVANLTPDQIAGFQTIRNVAGSGNPYLSQIQNAYSTYGNTPASSVNVSSLLGGGVNPNNTTLQNYMDQNISTELNPTLAEIERQRQIAVSGTGGVGSQATGAGGSDAFGDARAGVEAANTNAAALRAAGQATGTAYQNAHQNALQALGIDRSNALNAQTTNAGLNEQYLARVLGSGNALQGLDAAQMQRGLTQGQSLLSIGGQQQAQDQAILNLPWLNNQGQQAYELAALQGQNAATTAAVPAAGYTNYGQGTVQQPNNSGWGMLGSLGGAILGNMIMPGVGGAIGSSLGGSLANMGGAGGILGAPGGYAGNGWGNNMLGGDIYGNVPPAVNAGIGHA